MFRSKGNVYYLHMYSGIVMFHLLLCTACYWLGSGCLNACYLFYHLNLLFHYFFFAEKPVDTLADGCISSLPVACLFVYLPHLIVQLCKHQCWMERSLECFVCRCCCCMVGSAPACSPANAPYVIYTDDQGQVYLTSLNFLFLLLFNFKIRCKIYVNSCQDSWMTVN